VKALWSIRNLSQNTQKIYSRNLRRLCRETDVNEPVKVESHVFGLDVTNKFRNALFDSYSHYCKANEIARAHQGHLSTSFRTIFPHSSHLFDNM
jgi:hypothetical protein